MTFSLRRLAVGSYLKSAIFLSSSLPTSVHCADQIPHILPDSVHRTVVTEFKGPMGSNFNSNPSVIEGLITSIAKTVLTPFLNHSAVNTQPLGHGVVADTQFVLGSSV